MSTPQVLLLRYLCCLDAAIRQHSLDGQLLRALMQHLHAVGLPRLGAAADAALAEAAASGSGVDGERAEGARLADAAMALTPPACLHLLTRAAMARLQEIVQVRVVPVEVQLRVVPVEVQVRLVPVEVQVRVVTVEVEVLKLIGEVWC